MISDLDHSANQPQTDSGTEPESLWARVLGGNPFTDNRSNGPAAPTNADVAAVHGGVFQRLIDLATEALQVRRGIGAVLWGEAGIGKSHLLARLGRWAGGSPENKEPHAAFVFLHNLQSAPEHLPRAVLRTAVGTLTASPTPASRHTSLFALVHAALCRAVNDDLKHYSWDELERAFLRWARQAAHDSPVPGDTVLYRVLFRYFRSRLRTRQRKENGADFHRAVRWLSGHPLDPDEARLLGLPVTGAAEPTVLADNQAIKEVLVALCRLAAALGQPFILAFDQVDNLDDEQFAALARFLEALIDAAPNLFVVTAGIQTTLLEWKETKVIQESAWHRLAQFELQLRRVSPELALELVRQRLDRVFAGCTALAPLFPLGYGWQHRFCDGRLDVRPRDAINSAREAWRAEQDRLREQGGPEWLRSWPERQQTNAIRQEAPTAVEVQMAVDRKVAEFLAEHRARCQDDAALLPDGDRLAGLIFNLLKQCRDASADYRLLNVERVLPRRGVGRPGFDVIYDRQDGASDPVLRTGLVVVVEPKAVSVTARLRRLLTDVPPVQRAVLVTDERVGLLLGKAGQDYLNDLSRRWPERFWRIRLTFADLVELEGLQAAVSAAHSGDLEARPGPDVPHLITPAEVIAAHQRHGRYRASPLLRELLTADRSV